MKDGVVWLFTEMTAPVLRALRVLASKIGSGWLKSALVLTSLLHLQETAVLASTERWPKPAGCLECSSGTYQLDIRWCKLAAPSNNSLSVSTGNCIAGFYREVAKPNCTVWSSGSLDQLDIRWRELVAPSGNSLSVSTGNCSAGFYKKMT